MNYFPAIFEFLGTTEMLVIALVALIVFGPRKLPEIGRSIGKSLSEFKRASDDFKRTWEREVELDKIERDLHIDINAPPPPMTPAISVAARDGSQLGAGQAQSSEVIDVEARTIARTSALDVGRAEAESSDAAQDDAPDAAREETSEPPLKRDWL